MSKRIEEAVEVLKGIKLAGESLFTEITEGEPGIGQMKRAWCGIDFETDNAAHVAFEMLYRRGFDCRVRYATWYLPPTVIIDG